jgi:23S rRNA (cytidine1920-2'-O)/16S rRNA (cytidine1409-2'-O)-methyltransferase
MADTAPQRLDQFMVAARLVATRARAQDLIKRGFVHVNGKVCDKPAQIVGEGAHVVLADNTPGFVSRGAEKLVAALDHFGFDPRGRAALDVGASTGGFTEVLLQRGAEPVYAVDVGRGQLHERLRRNPRIVSLEEQDIRLLDRGLISQLIGAITADVSFISLTKALPVVLELAGPEAFLVALIKPQFELTPADIGKGGIVRDEAARDRAIENVRAFVAGTSGWRVQGVTQSPISGGSGNIEYLLGAIKNG